MKDKELDALFSGLAETYQAEFNLDEGLARLRAAGYGVAGRGDRAGRNAPDATMQDTAVTKNVHAVARVVKVHGKTADELVHGAVTVLDDLARAESPVGANAQDEELTDRSIVVVITEPQAVAAAVSQPAAASVALAFLLVTAAGLSTAIAFAMMAVFLDASTLVVTIGAAFSFVVVECQGFLLLKKQVGAHRTGKRSRKGWLRPQFSQRREN